MFLILSDFLNLEKNIHLACKYYNDSVKNGYALASLNLGYFYKKGLGGVTLNNNHAFKLFLSAAEQRISDAMVEVGYCYFNGIGIRSACS